MLNPKQVDLSQNPAIRHELIRGDEEEEMVDEIEIRFRECLVGKTSGFQFFDEYFGFGGGHSISELFPDNIIEFLIQLYLNDEDEDSMFKSLKIIYMCSSLEMDFVLQFMRKDVISLMIRQFHHQSKEIVLLAIYALTNFLSKDHDFLDLLDECDFWDHIYAVNEFLCVKKTDLLEMPLYIACNEALCDIMKAISKNPSISNYTSRIYSIAIVFIYSDLEFVRSSGFRILSHLISMQIIRSIPEDFNEILYEYALNGGEVLDSLFSFVDIAGKEQLLGEFNYDLFCENLILKIENKDQYIKDIIRFLSFISIVPKHPSNFWEKLLCFFFTCRYDTKLEIIVFFSSFIDECNIEAVGSLIKGGFFENTISIVSDTSNPHYDSFLRLLHGILTKLVSINHEISEIVFLNEFHNELLNVQLQINPQLGALYQRVLDLF